MQDNGKMDLSMEKGLIRTKIKTLILDGGNSAKRKEKEPTRMHQLG